MRITVILFFFMCLLLFSFRGNGGYSMLYKRDTIIRANDTVQLFFKQIVKHRYLPSLVHGKDTISIAGWDTGVYSDPFVNISPNRRYAIIPHYKLTRVNGKITEQSEERQFQCAMIDLISAKVLKKEIRWCSGVWNFRNELNLTDSVVFNGR